MASKPVRFLAVGLWNTVFGYGSFVLFEYGCKYLNWSYLVALVASQVVSVLNAYLCYKFVVFKVTAHSWRESGRFGIVYCCYFVANLLLLPFLVKVVKIHPIPAQGIVVLGLAMASYIGHNRFTFRQA